MRKIMLAGLVLAVGMFGTLRSAHCASVGAPGTQPGKFSVGLEQDYIFDRDMGSNSYLMDLGEPDDYTLSGTTKYKVQDLGRTMLRVGYQISKNLNIYTKLGVTNDNGGFNVTSTGTWEDEDSNTGTFDIEGKFKGASASAWGLGFKLLFPLQNNWIIGADAQYLTHKNDYSGKVTGKAFNSDGTLSGEISEDIGDIGSATISEWHVAPFIARDFGKVVPYVGVKYSDLQIKPDKGDMTLNASNNVGVFVGADFKFNEMFSLNLEGRFIDETAMTLAAMFTF